MKKSSVILLMLLPFALLSQSNKAGQNFKEKVFFGGGLGLGIGSNYTSVEVSPLAGYMITDDFRAGVKVIYQYYSGSTTVGPVSYDYSGSVYGGSLFGMHSFFDKIVAYAEYEFLNVDKQMYNPLERGRIWLGSPIVGGGISQGLGKSKLVLLVLWNFNDGLYVPYSNPIIRMSFMF